MYVTCSLKLLQRYTFTIIPATTAIITHSSFCQQQQQNLDNDTVADAQVLQLYSRNLSVCFLDKSGQRIPSRNGQPTASAGQQ